MNLVDRAKNILLQPKQEWNTIAAETTDVKTLYTSYIMILAAIPAIVSIISSAILGSMLGKFGGASIGLGFGVVAAIVSYVLGLGMVYVVALIADALAPSFDGEKNFIQSLKLVAFSMTASWVGSIFNIIPLLGWLISLLASLYGVYLFYTGVTPMKKVPDAKAVGYTIVVIIAAIVVGFIIGAITSAIVMMGAAGAVGGIRGF
jgi:hypothetical protein